MDQTLIFGTPAKTYATLAIVPIFLSLMGMAFSDGVAPNLPVAGNPAFITCLVLLATGCACLIAPQLFSWEWETRHYGVLAFYSASVSIIGIIPLMSIAMFGNFRVATAVAAVAYFIPIARSIHICIRHYHEIFADERLAGILYQHEEDASYYIQKGDRYLIKRKQNK